MNCEDAPYSGANESKCQGDHKWQLKCLPASLDQLKKELYNSPLSLEEKLILHMLSSVKHSPGSYESASETSDQTVAQCQDKLQKLLSIMCSYGVSGPTSIPQSFLRTFLKLCSNSVHFKKRRSIEQALSKCQEHNAGHAVAATMDEKGHFILQTSFFNVHCSFFKLHCSFFNVHSSNFILQCSFFILQTSNFILHSSMFVVHSSNFIVHCSDF